MRVFRTIWFSAVLCCAGLLTAGYAYRLAAVRLDALVQEPVLPVMPLSSFPYEIGGWEGEDQPLRDTILEVAGNDDYIHRSYQHPELGYYVTLYVAFTSQPRNMLGHRPRVCYAGAGWEHDGSEPQEVVSAEGETLPVLVHYFHKSVPNQTRIVVLNYYFINGGVSTDYRDFSGFLWRLPTFSRDQIRYVAQVQIGSVSSTAAISFASEIASLIRPYMPVERADKE